MELIPYEQFERLQLVQFQPDTSRITSLRNWEYMGCVWVGEAEGFTAFLRPEASPHALGSIELDLVALAGSLAAGILASIRLPLRPGMSAAEVQQILGVPERTQRFVSDRTSFDFTVGSRWPYHVACTIHEAQGLIHVGVIRKDHLAAFAAP